MPVLSNLKRIVWGCRRTMGWIVLIMATLTGCVHEIKTPVNTKLDLTQAALTRNRIGMECLQMGDIERAQMELEHARQLDPDLAETYNGLGLVYSQEGDLKRAEANFRRALKLDVNNGQAQTDYGAFLFHQGKLPEACEHFSQASQNVLYANRAIAFENLGLCYAQRGMIEPAEAAFIRALKMNDHLAVSTLELSEIFFDQKEYARAQSGYEGYLRLMGDKPLSARALWLGWRLALWHGNRQAQIDLALKLRVLYPDSPEYREYRKVMGMAPVAASPASETPTRH